MTPRRTPRKPLNHYARFSGLLFQMIAIIGVGTYAGIKLDQTYPNKSDTYTILLATGSVVLSIYVTVKQIIRRSKEDE